MQQAQETIEELEGPTAQQSLLALMVLDRRITKLKAALLAERKQWAERLGETTEKLNDKLRDPVPAKGGECKARLHELQDLDTERQDQKASKNIAIERLKAKVAESEQAFYDILRRQKNPSQMNLNFTDAGANFDPSAGIILDQKYLDTVRSAVNDFSSEGGTADGLEDLTSRLDEIGAAGLEFPDVGEDDDDGGEDGDEDGDGDEAA